MDELAAKIDLIFGEESLNVIEEEETEDGVDKEELT